MGREYTSDHIHKMQSDIRANLPPGAAGALLDILDKVKSGVPMTDSQMAAMIRLGEQQASQYLPNGAKPGDSNAQVVGALDQTANYMLGLQTSRMLLETAARAPDTLAMNAGTMTVLTHMAAGYSDPDNWWDSYDDWGYDELDFASYLWNDGYDLDPFGDGYGFELSLEDLMNEDITPSEFFGLQGNENEIAGMVGDFGREMNLDVANLEMVKGPQVQASAPDNDGLDFGAQPSGISGPAMKLPA